MKMIKMTVVLILCTSVYSFALNPFIDSFLDQSYGKQGSFHSSIDTAVFRSNGHKCISICFLPDGKVGRYPVIFFCHGINETDYKAYSGLISHIVSKGYGLVYTPYKSIPVSNKLKKSYDILYDGFRAAVTLHKDVFDTNKIGFTAHSFGGGAAPYVSNRLIKGDGWGSKGSFLYIMAPWYPCVITPEELANYNKETHLVMQVFDGDRINDPRIAKAIYNLIGIPKENKKYLFLYGDSIPGFTLTVDHGFPCKTPDQITTYHKNALFRTFDLLASTSFDNDSVADHELFSCRDKKNVPLAIWRFGYNTREAIFTDNAVINRPQKDYVNFWDHVINPLNEFNTNFECPKPIFFHTRVTLRNYRNAFLNRGKAENVRSENEFARPPTEFGSEGRYFMDRIEIPNPRLRTRPVEIFVPRGIDTPAPVIFLSHSFLCSGVRNYRGLIEHLVSKGNIVVYVHSVSLELVSPFRMRYDVLMSGFKEATDLLINHIDTTRVGFIGHGFSAGAVPTIAQNFLSSGKWGGNGSFLFLSSPWYMYYMDKNKLNGFPDNMKMIVQTYQDDRTNDWRIGLDIFNSLGLHKENKNFVILCSDHNGKRKQKADILTICGRTGYKGRKQVNALDYYGVYRLIDALEASAFYNDSSGRKVALGWNCPEQKFMGNWRDGTPIKELISTDRPQNFFKRKHYYWSWNSVFNKRRKLESP